ncbi:ribosomal maturation YjgA family protein [Spirosoma validum]|uniref:DUF2809 domain-containing protein n=1 Tax=Spirosoma validum TaxID=2771355 RepID=A0A927B2Z9_9BACT|nr:DUF2809 domain-containing protein [Spirosoma validum]MBD2754287.1 DUF2809 domain-containing protein [Spirosoma validum]
MLVFNRSRIVYGLLMISVVLMGLASRSFFGEIAFIKTYVGDALWSLMVFFGFAATFRQWSTKTVTLAAMLFSFGIEISQLYHAPWIDSLRATRLGGLVLGFSFVWSDLLCYSLGIAVGVFVETYLIPGRYKSRPKPSLQISKVDS